MNEVIAHNEAILSRDISPAVWLKSNQIVIAAVQRLLDCEPIRAEACEQYSGCE
jgi:hypothetical protein